MRYQPEYRTTVDAIRDVRILAPSGERVALQQVCTFGMRDGASQIYRENNSRYVAIKFSVRGRDLSSTVDEAIRRVNESVKLRPGYYLQWAGEYASAKRANARLAVIVPVTVAVIFFLLYSMFGSFKWAGLAMVSLALSPIGALFALYFTGTHFSVSSGIGTLALFGRGRRNGSHHDRVHQPATCTWLQR